MFSFLILVDDLETEQSKFINYKLFVTDSAVHKHLSYLRSIADV